MTAGPRILLSEASSLSAREAITALGQAGHSVEVMSNDRLAIGCFSRFVRKVHPAPPSGTDPDGYVEAVLEVIARRGIEVLLPVHEQAYLFAAARHRLPEDVGAALAAFSAFEQVQSKTAFSALLTSLGAPQPNTEIARSAEDLARARPFPFFVKSDFGTASTGVRRIADRADQAALVASFETAGGEVGRLLVQAAAIGPLERCQAVFDQGRLVAFHAYRQIAEGPGGGDILKVSVRRPEAAMWTETIGSALVWHGALSFDYILEASSGSPLFFDANPRLVEPMNAWLSGVDLPGALLAVSRGASIMRRPDGREGVTTRLGVMGLLDAAREGGRLGVLAAFVAMAARTGRYRNSREELTPLGADPYTLAPLMVVLASSLLSPARAAKLTGRTVSAYSLTDAAYARLRQWPRDNGG